MKVLFGSRASTVCPSTPRYQFPTKQRQLERNTIQAACYRNFNYRGPGGPRLYLPTLTTLQYGTINSYLTVVLYSTVSIDTYLDISVIDNSVYSIILLNGRKKLPTSSKQPEEERRNDDIRSALHALDRKKNTCRQKHQYYSKGLQPMNLVHSTKGHIHITFQLTRVGINFEIHLYRNKAS